MEPSKTDRLLLIARQYTEAIAQCRAALMNGTAGDAGICWQTEIWEAILRCAQEESETVDRLGFGYINALKLASPLWNEIGITLQYQMAFQTENMSRNLRSCEQWLHNVFGLDLQIDTRIIAR